MDLASLKTRDNSEKHRFEIKVDDEMAFLDYKIGKSGDVYMVHTEVPEKLGGQGVGHKLVRESLEIIENHGCQIIPLCPFVRSFLQDHREDYGHLLSEKAKL
ncbi:GNAT family N-acetyltransferase [Ekhidna sp.]|uniref:GNAT family N-acetyltransferase n=1 Tax=Ekhidna sp. TaxID=2608089 RepID=UPI003512F6C6